MGELAVTRNPVVRDVHEYCLCFSKGRFDRVVKGQATIEAEEFMDATLSIWEIPPESASRVGHPAPFPVELPERLIHLYTYRHDLVLDPFMGSGTTAVAAVRTERHYVGYDTDASYVEAAKKRLEDEQTRAGALAQEETTPLRVSIDPGPGPAARDEDFQARAVREGLAARDLAREALERCGFTDIESEANFPEGVEVNFRARDQKDGIWHFDVSGGFTSNRPGLKRTDTLWKAIDKAAVLHAAYPGIPLILSTTDAPVKGSAGDEALRVLKGPGRPIRDVIVFRAPDDLERLRSYAVSGTRARSRGH